MQKSTTRSQLPSDDVQSSQNDSWDIEISIANQSLILRRNNEVVRSFPISSSRFGLGMEEGSRKTPLGRFKIGQKIGHGMPHGTVFRSRVPLSPAEALPETEDLITSRILWLEGLEPHNANTKDRFIYIHGTKHEDRIGQPDSHGCIRMRNADVIELFDLVQEGTLVRIVD
jgi:lipoprotein-anchoring transpeptidase ErfK/SrfK